MKLVFEKNGTIVIPVIYEEDEDELRVIAAFEDGAYSFTIAKDEYEDVVGAARFADVADNVRDPSKIRDIDLREHKLIIGDHDAATLEDLTKFERFLIKRVLEESPKTPPTRQVPLNKIRSVNDIVAEVRERARELDWIGAVEYTLQLSEEVYTIVEVRKALEITNNCMSIIDEKARQVFYPVAVDVLNLLLENHGMKNFVEIGITGSGKVRTEYYNNCETIIPFKEGVYRVRAPPINIEVFSSDSVIPARNLTHGADKLSNGDYSGDIVIHDKSVKLPEVSEVVRERAREALGKDGYLFLTVDALILSYLATGEWSVLRKLYKVLYYEGFARHKDSWKAYMEANERLFKILTTEPEKLVEEAAKRHAEYLKKASELV